MVLLLRPDHPVLGGWALSKRKLLDCCLSFTSDLEAVFEKVSKILTLSDTALMA